MYKSIVIVQNIITFVVEEEEDASEESDDSLADPLLSGKDNAGLTVGDIIEQARQQALKGVPLDAKLSEMLICCGCLGDRSDDINEIVECDGCGVTVHEGTHFKDTCYICFKLLYALMNKL